MPGRRAPDPKVFYRSIADFLRDQPKVQRRFWTLVLGTGVAAGLAAVGLAHLLAFIQGTAWPAALSLLEAVRQASPGHRVAVLGLGGLVVVGVAWFTGKPLGGHGTAGIIEAIWVRSGMFSLRRALLRGVVTVTVVGMGAPLGREGALISTGAGAGSWLARKLQVPADKARVLVACGAAAGIAAAYNVPLGGALFGLEVLLGSFALELFGPIVVSCVTATAISRILLESHPAYEIPYYRMSAPLELASFLLLAPLFGVASSLFIRVIEGLAVLKDRAPSPLAAWLPVVSMLSVGTVAIWLPQILGNGYDTANLALLGKLPLTLLLLLPFVKLLASALVAGSGVPGGLFTPSLFFGALLGGAAGVLAQHVWPGAAPPGAYALIGMAAVLAGTTHAAISAVLIIFEMTRDYGVILPLMLTCVITAAVSRLMTPESLYTGVLARRGVPLPESPQPRWMREARIGPMIEPDVTTVQPSARFDDLVLQLLGLPPGHDLYVVGPDGRLQGLVVLDELKGHLPDRRDLAMVCAVDVMDTRIAPLQAGMSLQEAAGRFGGTYLERLPVVDAGGKLLGTVSKSRLVRRAAF